MDTPRLDTVINRIKKHYVLPNNHKTLAAFAPEEKRVVVLNHACLSIVESVGKISSEQKKHGVLREDNDALKDEAVRIFTNALVIAQELNMSAHDICKGVARKFMEDR